MIRGTFLQIRVVAYDSCNPVQQVVAIVRITVIRNKNQPIFDREEYTSSIFETIPVGDIILTVKATDADEGVSGDLVYSLDLENSVPSDLGKFFYVNPTTGNVTIIGRLTDDPSKRVQYIVSQQRPMTIYFIHATLKFVLRLCVKTVHLFYITY